MGPVTPRPVISWETLELRTAQPFGIARWTASSYARTIVEFRQGEFSGRGEAAPNAYYGETAATVAAILPLLSGALVDAWDWQGLEANLKRLLPQGHPSVRCALEMAALEWCAVSVGRPVWGLLGLSPVALPETSFSVGLAEPEVMRAQLKAALGRGHRILKVKLGGQRDQAVIELLRTEAPQAAIRVDANASWTRAQARRMLGVLQAADIELLEQPLAACDLDGHAELRRISRVPIIADESLHHLGDLRGLAGAFDGVNFKTAKLGGPLQVLRGIHQARALGLGVMLGCMIESSLGVAGAAHLGGLADWLDLDGALLLEHDPFGGLEWQAGVLERPSAPGWGVHRVSS
ncbi:dipeptide epimerase [Deinococcus sp.]|uniref:dipeptide epimerase n=1 Tax=Deinococcus sp. TaxID=47478 RepID=UPI0025DC7C97|nr:dipeptide epimerase [Deinococcus sp.]